MTDDFEIDDFLHRHIDDMCSQRLLEALTGMDRAGMALLGASITKVNAQTDYVEPREPIFMTTEISAKDMMRRFKIMTYGVETKYQHR
jgi:hypothetical protein